jgi:ADP-ribose pyrophosphatase YjhB (NUDIX family)
MFICCPVCASRNVRFEENKKYYCPDCGLEYYHNTAAATGCIFDVDGSAVLLVRGKEPCRGGLDLPGGFVDPGEGALEGLIRECREELGWDPPAAYPASHFTFLASFPNKYPYKNFIYNTCDLFFTFEAPGLSAADFRLQREEVSAVRFIRPEDIDYKEIAFDSARHALRALAELKR